MAKSKSGGTRSYLRGRIASDVYSIGRDSNGKKQQVVRSLAEQVKNPQTIAQMRGRMIMSTVMQAVSGMSPIIDHSFDNVPNGQPSISEFIRRNYALIKEDVAAHPASGNVFGLNKYQVKGVQPGRYIISDGKAIMPASVNASVVSDGILEFAYSNTATTAGAVRAALGFGGEDYVTMCTIRSNGTFVFFRVKVSSALADDTTLTTENVASLFEIESPFGIQVSVGFEAGQIDLSLNISDPSASGVIFSKNVDGGFEHSTSTIAAVAPAGVNADTALPTYPVGEERFLNGGEL